MFTIRKGQFETNSSSTHCLIIDKNCGEKLGETIDLSADNYTGDFIRPFIRRLDEETSKVFVNWLYTQGVKNIIYNGSNEFINKFAEEYKDSYTDMGFPDLYEFKNYGDEGLISFLLGYFEEYYGYEDVDYDDDEFTYIL